MTTVQPLSQPAPPPSIPIGPAIQASFSFIAVAWRRAWGVMLLLVWISAMAQAIEGLKPEWKAAPTLGVLALLIVSTIATGALYRIGLEADHPGDPAFAPSQFGLQWAGIEWRVLGANVLVGVILGILALAVFIIWGVGLGISYVGHPEALQAINSAGTDQERMAASLALLAGPAGVVSVIVLLPGLVALIYLAIRLALFTLNTVDTRAYDFAKAWALTRGAVLSLFVALVAIYIAQIIAGGVCGAVAGFFSAFFAHGAGGMWGQVAGQAAGAAINAPLFAGLQLYVLHRRKDAGVAATFA